jgi:hypothetical protein
MCRTVTRKPVPLTTEPDGYQPARITDERLLVTAHHEAGHTVGRRGAQRAVPVYCRLAQASRRLDRRIADAVP